MGYPDISVSNAKLCS